MLQKLLNYVTVFSYPELINKLDEIFAAFLFFILLPNWSFIEEIISYVWLVMIALQSVLEVILFQSISFTVLSYYLENLSKTSFTDLLDNCILPYFLFRLFVETLLHEGWSKLTYLGIILLKDAFQHLVASHPIFFFIHWKV